MYRIRNNKKKKFVTGILLLLILVFLIIENIILRNNIGFNSKKLTKKLLTDEKVILKFDLNKPLEPAELYDAISCKLSSKFAGVETILCVYDENDYDSRSILKSGISNGFIMTEFTKDINKCGGDCIILDIGADLGQYTLFAAKLGKNVIAVEPFEHNLLRIHKASNKDNLNDKIILIQNVIFKFRNKFVDIIKKNSSIKRYESRYQMRIENSSSVSKTKTITFIDFYNQIPIRSDGTRYKNIIMRINLNGFERFWLVNATELFESYDVKSIYMNWYFYTDETGFVRTDGLKIQAMIDYLLNRNFLPLEISTNGQLNVREWEEWPEFIVWKKKGF